MKIGIVRDGKIVAQTTEPANSKAGLGPQLPVLKAAWMLLLRENDLCLSECKGASISFPSLVDTTTGKVLAEYGKFADAPGLDLRAWARQELSLPLAIENDARMALIGEWRWGTGKGCDNLAMITLGTGLGTCAIIEGKVLRGKHGQAGVLCGHLTVNHNGRKCTCGNIGCAEAEASTSVLARIPTPSGKTVPGLDYRRVFELAAQGDADAIFLQNHSLKVWGALAVNLIHAYDPEMLILGGGIMGSADLVLPAIRSYVSQTAHTPWGKVNVVASALGDQAGMIAAEWLLQEQFPEQ
jgi:glucokinase